jgi:hypothetical protein
MKNRHLGRAKSPEFDDHNRIHIANMNPVVIVEPREISR